MREKKQEAQLSQRGRTMLHVIERLAKSLKVVENLPFKSFGTVSYLHSTETTRPHL